MADRPTRRVTAADVAAAAGVSQTTVSYVLGDRPNQSISEATRVRVRQAAEALGYVPSAAARALAKGRSELVVGLLADWPVGPNMGQFFRRLTASFAARDLAFLTQVAPFDCADAALLPLLRKIAPVAVLGFGDYDQGKLEQIRSIGVEAAVLVWTAAGSGAGVLGKVDYEAGRKQAQLMVVSGHRHLGYAWPDDPRLVSFARPRHAGVQSVCAECDLAAPVVRTVSLDRDRAAEAILAWRAASPQVNAICAYNDEVAAALLGGMRQLGLATPTDLAIVGADDLPTSSMTVPPLTTLNYDRAGMAEYVAAGTAELLRGGAFEASDGIDLVRLVQRETA